MERREVMARIKELGLQKDVEKVSGRNYTQTSTAILEQILWDYDCTLVDKDPAGAEAPEAITTQKNKVAPTEVTNAYEAACVAFVSILKDSGKLDEILAKL